jgi:tRNA A-37 threonylcarbamoyl transferase component Bud32
MSLLRLTPGTVFAGDFEIIGPLAEGGMGAVYVAKQRSTGKERALKVMQAQFVTDSRNRERFTREARAGSQVDSEHVVEVVAAGIDAETNLPWIAMELLRGEDLESFATRVGPLSQLQTLEIFRQLCHGLAAAHASGLVHRDLKPENVFLAAARHVGVPFTVKLLDFGIAKMVQETKHDVTDAVGTPTWMAPEQTESGRSITPATDVWALGLIAFRLLSGYRYWKASQGDDASPMAILREVVFDPMEPASIRARSLGSRVQLSTSFDGWFSRCLSRDASRRFPNASSTLAALEPILSKTADAAASALLAPLERAPATIRGEPFGGQLVSATDTFRENAPPLPATRVGPFTGPADTERMPKTSAPPAEDVDHYQRRLAGGKLRVLATAMILLGAAGGVAWMLRQRAATPTPFSGNEVEPNNRAPEATVLPFGEKVRGQIGQRIDADRSDRDFYRATAPKGNRYARLWFRALPNIAPCVFLYRADVDEPFARFCAGQPARDLVIPVLKLEGGEYLFAILQDREQYTDDPAPPVLENISDTYEFEVTPTDAAADLEQEPNETRETSNAVATNASIRARLAWMRDVDTFCAKDWTPPIRFVVEDNSPRPRGAVLEVTPLGGPTDGIPVRVHHARGHGVVNERDLRSPWKGPVIAKPGNACLSITLTRDVWSDPPLPHVPPASDHEYVVRIETP